MRKSLIALALLLTVVPPGMVPAQQTTPTVKDRLDKARLEVNATQNATARARTALTSGNTAKAQTEMQAANNAASRALYAIDQALKAVLPPPPVVSWKQCAVEGAMCAVEGTAFVRYGDGTTWTAPRAVTGLIACENSIFGDPSVGKPKVCQTDGVVGTPPVEPPVVCPDGTVIKMGADCPVTPPPTNAQWVPAPLKVGGYGYLVNNGPCCNGLIVLVSRAVMSDDADPNTRHLIYYGRYVADPSGNFPAIPADGYWATKELGGWGEGPLVNGSGGLIGVAPVAMAPATGMRPTYGDTVTALAACVGQTDPATLLVGARYVVKGLRTTLPVGGNATPMNLPDTVVLNPVVDDGLHRGDGWWGLTVPASCVQKA